MSQLSAWIHAFDKTQKPASDKTLQSLIQRWSVQDSLKQSKVFSIEDLTTLLANTQGEMPPKEVNYYLALILGLAGATRGIELFNLQRNSISFDTIRMDGRVFEVAKVKFTRKKKRSAIVEDYFIISDEVEVKFLK